MYKLLLLTILTIVIQTISFASGQREISLKTCLEGQCQEIPLAQLDRKANYLGTTEQWHLFAKVSTSSSENSDGSVGMPFDHVDGFKIARDKVKVEAIKSLNKTELQMVASIRGCPDIINIDMEQQLIIVEGDHKNCLIE